MELCQGRPAGVRERLCPSGLWLWTGHPRAVGTAWSCVGLEGTGTLLSDIGCGFGWYYVGLGWSRGQQGDQPRACNR